MGLIGKMVWIIKASSPYYGKSGIVRGFDGERYLVAFDSKKVVLKRNQFVVG